MEEQQFTPTGIFHQHECQISLHNQRIDVPQHIGIFLVVQLCRITLLLFASRIQNVTINWKE